MNMWVRLGLLIGGWTVLVALPVVVVGLLVEYFLTGEDKLNYELGQGMAFLAIGLWIAGVFGIVYWVKPTRAHERDRRRFNEDEHRRDD